jgi:hypothetical protein
MIAARTWKAGVDSPSMEKALLELTPIWRRFVETFIEGKM